MKIAAILLNIKIDTKLGSLKALPSGTLSNYRTRLNNRATKPKDIFSSDQHVCMGISPKTNINQGLCRIMRFDDLWYYHIEPTKNQINNKKVRQQKLDQLKRDPSKIRKKLKGHMRTGRNLFWLCIDKDLSDLQSPPYSKTNIPDKIRDFLGLLHIGKNVDLIQLTFPKDFFAKLKVPTFIDGGDNEAFAVWDHPARQTGFTWNLSSNTQGIGELVSNDSKLDSNVEIKYIGQTQS